MTVKTFSEMRARCPPRDIGRTKVAKESVARDVEALDGEGRRFRRGRRDEIDTASPEELIAVIAEAEETKARAWARLVSPKAAAVREPDQALNARQVGKRIGVGKDWVYEHGDEIPGSWETREGIRRWSAAAVEAWKMREGKSKGRKENG
jgi:predicted DNA-binding transcriptional regulator AlpA